MGVGAFSAMGKRAESRPEISGRLLDVVNEARAAVGKELKPKPANTRPQASPARIRKPAAADAAVTTAADAPGISTVQLTPAPMSVQSTPVKSPDFKKLRSGTSECTSEMSLPSLPSFSGKSSSSGMQHGLDSQTTLDMAEYFSQMRVSGQREVQCM